MKQMSLSPASLSARHHDRLQCTYEGSSKTRHYSALSERSHPRAPHQPGHTLETSQATPATSPSRTPRARRSYPRALPARGSQQTWHCSPLRTPPPRTTLCPPRLPPAGPSLSLDLSPNLSLQRHVRHAPAPQARPARPLARRPTRSAAPQRPPPPQRAQAAHSPLSSPPTPRPPPSPPHHGHPAPPPPRADPAPSRRPAPEGSPGDP